MKYYRGDVLSSLLLHSSLQYDDDVHLFQNFHHKELNAWGQNGLEGDRRRKESTFSTLKLIMRFRSVLPFGIFVLQEEQQPLHPSYITYCIRNNPLIPSFSCLIVSCQCSEKMFEKGMSDFDRRAKNETSVQGIVFDNCVCNSPLDKNMLRWEYKDEMKLNELFYQEKWRRSRGKELEAKLASLWSWMWREEEELCMFVWESVSQPNLSRIIGVHLSSRSVG